MTDTDGRDTSKWSWSCWRGTGGELDAEGEVGAGQQGGELDAEGEVGAGQQGGELDAEGEVGAGQQGGELDAVPCKDPYSASSPGKGCLLDAVGMEALLPEALLLPRRGSPAQ
jgi:hypothetical protein